MPEHHYQGILCIGDPHIASRAPEFRKDDYPRTILGKLEWTMNYASANRLLPILLGDLFHWPRDNANWLLVELIDLFDQHVLAVWGNHDCQENQLTEHDTLSILVAKGSIALLDRTGPWHGVIGGTSVIIGGTPWGHGLPDHFERPSGDAELVFWIAHHDIRFPGSDPFARLNCAEIPGIDAVINGHIHLPAKEVVCGRTTWLNPGNISRIRRADANRNRAPSVLRIDISNAQWTQQTIEVPHQPFDQVFHAQVPDETQEPGDSLFVRGLAQLQSLKTASGAGLRVFLDQNLDQFEPPVANEIRALAQEVLCEQPITDDSGH